MLAFDEVKHVYTLDGQIIPSVTTIMKPLSQHVYKGVDEAVLNEAARKGTIVHNAIENWLKFGFEDIPEEQKGYFDAYKAFEADYKPVMLESEYRMCHNLLRYAGTADFLCEINGEATLIDFKTTSVLYPKLTRVQLEAYKQAAQTMGREIKHKAILQLKPDGKYVFERHDDIDIEAWAMFGHLLAIYGYITKK